MSRKIMKKNFSKMNKSQLIRECNSLEFRRKTAWTHFYEEMDHSWSLCKKLREIKEVSEIGLPPHFLELLTGCEDRCSCPICYCEFENTKDIRITKCHHIFHPECLISWGKPTCPKCRKTISIPVKPKEKKKKLIEVIDDDDDDDE